MQLNKITIVGPGGNVGGGAIQELSKHSQFKLTALLRPTSAYKAPEGININLITVDFTSQSSLVEALKGQDAVLSCFGGHNVRIKTEKILIDASIEAGVKLFFANEYVTNIMREEYAQQPPEWVGEKVLVRNYLEEKVKEGKIAYTALNGGPFFDMWFLMGPAGFDIPKRTSIIYGTGNNPSCWTSRATIHKAITAMLLNPTPVLNRGIFICGVKDVTQLSLLEAVEAELGEKFKVEYQDIKKIYQDALGDLAKGNFKAASRGLALSSNFDEDVSKADFYRWNKVENELLGIEAQTVREAVAEALKQAGYKSDI